MGLHLDAVFIFITKYSPNIFVYLHQWNETTFEPISRKSPGCGISARTWNENNCICSLHKLDISRRFPVGTSSDDRVKLVIICTTLARYRRQLFQSAANTTKHRTRFVIYWKAPNIIELCGDTRAPGECIANLCLAAGEAPLAANKATYTLLHCLWMALFWRRSNWMNDPWK